MSESTEQLEVWCAGKDWCPVTATATLIGKKWHTVVLHRLLDNGPLGFNALKEEVGGISSKVLSDVLEDLEQKQLINREIVNEKPVRVEYSLTDLGKSLESVILEMADWGQKHLMPAETKDNSITSV
ncbi:winged helix-turn-helix transcriptional regulator [Natronorubrum aibiense]|uniref:Transcriptional regulator n=1 Tax=Natronorubrum aibiense TaxID=348826 RepID=A0A5P9P9F7_9EURY|nr:helix-turn-helix domain-containing protein [Natronorubrum aibiense]QFU84732.1 transcriptional regulator [Natronorubrum aibiense]